MHFEDTERKNVKLSKFLSLSTITTFKLKPRKNTNYQLLSSQSQNNTYLKNLLVDDDISLTAQIKRSIIQKYSINIKLSKADIPKK